MAFSQADVTRLEAALAIGTLSVSVAGRQVTYRSTEDIAKALRFVKSQLAGTVGPRHQLADFSESNT